QGGAGADTVNGGTGDDTLSSGAMSFDGRGDLTLEVDTLIGQNGNDRIEIGMKDIADGGNDFDTLQLDFTASKLAENFVFSADMTFANGGSAKNFEALTFFGGRFADVVTGGANADTLYGGGGNDLLRGALGNDMIVDGQGRDRMFGDAGADIFRTSGLNADADIYDGGTDKDTLMFWDGEDDEEVESTMSGFLDLENQALNDGLLKGDTFKNIETFIGAGRDDFMFGNRLANTFIGGDGDDVLDGRAGNDLLVGGEGSDTLTGGLGKDIFDLSGQGNHGAWFGDIVTDFTRGEDKFQISLESLGLEGAPAFTVVVGNNPAPTGSGPQLLFDTATDRLWFDLDGAGTDHEGMLVATLEGVTTLAVSDFQFV
ncbi:MAG TPA: calcium-binding protein, partial [Allosphingosinicella sp.]